jgi:hypothetical protein
MYSIESAKNGKAVSAFFAVFVWLVIVALGSSFFLTPKPWFVQFAYALAGIASGGLAGLILGFIIGGIGIAVAGTAIAHSFHSTGASDTLLKQSEFNLLRNISYI